MHFSPKGALALTALAALGLAASQPASAQGLDGTSVTGSIQFNGGSVNYFDPANGFVPAGFANTAGATVTVTEPQVEFGFEDGANRDSADFRDGQLILTDVTFNGEGAGPATYSFTDAAFGSVTEVFDNFGGLTFSLVGNTLTINTPLTFADGTREAIFNINSSPVPEASTTASFGLLLALGMGGLIVAAKRKKQSA